jgi:hypothetical protein
MRPKEAVKKRNLFRFHSLGPIFPRKKIRHRHVRTPRPKAKFPAHPLAGIHAHANAAQAPNELPFFATPSF